MDLLVQIKVNERLFLKDPQTSELGRNLLRDGIQLMAGVGFEEFTFKKLAQKINTTEASIYRYFENKHRFLLYITSLYWNLLDFQLVFYTQNITDPKEKIDVVINLLVEGEKRNLQYERIDLQSLMDIVINESNKSYLTREVNKDNSNRLFKPYKDLCGTIAAIFLQYNPKYPFPRSLASTLIETSHLQFFFMTHLPLLTDTGTYKKKDYLKSFLSSLVYSVLNRKSAQL